MSGNGLAVREERNTLALSGSVQINSMADVFRLAEALSNARGFVPRALLGDPNGIAAAILTGIELGMGPMESMRSIHMVEGKPTMSADLMLARALRAGVRIEWERCDDTAAVLRLERSGMKHRATFSKQDAERAGLWGKNTWAKYPAAMLRARCISAAMRAFCPDVLGSGVYTIEELEPGAELARAEPASEPPMHESVTDQSITDVGEVVRVRPPLSLAEVSDESELRTWCSDNRSSLAKLTNGRRASAVQKIREAAARCGVGESDALGWAGLAEEAA